MPAIISKDTFNLAQAEMERRRTRKAPKSPKAEYLLAGRLFCGHCKGPMQGVSGTGKMCIRDRDKRPEFKPEEQLLAEFDK